VGIDYCRALARLWVAKLAQKEYLILSETYGFMLLSVQNGFRCSVLGLKQLEKVALQVFVSSGVTLAALTGVWLTEQPVTLFGSRVIFICGTICGAYGAAFIIANQGREARI
jgi:hypothetical protein